MLTVSRLLLFALGLIPLVVLPLTPYPFVLGKTLALRTGVELAAVCALVALARYSWTAAPLPEPLRCLADRQSWERLLHSRLFLAVAGFFVVSAGISAVMAPSVPIALFGGAMHGEGYFSILHYVVIAVLAGVLFSARERRRLIAILVCSSAILALFAWLQYFGVGWPPGLLPRTSQPGSFLGNPAHLASLLILALGMVVVLIEAGAFARIGLWTCGIAAGFFTATIFLTGIRGAMLGLAAGALSTATLIFLSRGASRIARATSLGFALALVAASITLFATREARIWSAIPGFDRVAQVSLEAPSIAARLISWRVSYNAWREKPVLGWGLEHYLVGYNRHHDPAYELYNEDWFDRAHNKIAEIAVTQGIVGVFFYAAFIAVLLARVRRSPWLFGAIVAYAVQNMFLFDTIAAYLALFAIIGYLLGGELDAGRPPGGAGARHRPKPDRAGHLFKWTVTLAAMIFTAAVCVHLLFNVYLPLTQARVFTEALKQPKGEGVLRESGRYLYPYNHFQGDLRAVLADKLVAENIVSSHRLHAAGQAVVAAIEETAILAGHDPRRHVRVAEMHALLSNHDPSHTEKALKFAEHALALAPNRLSVRYFYAFLLSKAGRFDESVRFMRETVALLPRSHESHYHLGINSAHAARAHAGTPLGDSYRTLASEAVQTAWSIGRSVGFKRLTDGNLHAMKTLFLRYEKPRLAAEVLDVMLARDPARREIHIESIKAYRTLRDAEGVVASARRMQRQFPGDSVLAEELDVIVELARRGNWAALDQF